MVFSFTCPHCGLAQIPTTANSGTGALGFDIGRFPGHVAQQHTSQTLAVEVRAIRCASFECRGITLTARAGSAKWSSGIQLADQTVIANAIPFPGRKGKPFPEGVPDKFIEDYNEAWSIVDLSPKASATLARRCLQGMIHDFCKIKERTLFDEITELKKRADEDRLPKGVEGETVDAMHALREVGNYGAHMKERGGEILDVAPGEAEALLGLIEMLFADWYVAKAKREARLAEIVAIAESKKAPPASEGAETEAAQLTRAKPSNADSRKS